MRRLAGSKRGAESRRLRRRINYQLGILTDSLGKRTVNRQLGRERESVWKKKKSIGVCLLIPDTDPRHDAVWRLGGGGRVPLRRGAVRGEVLVDESGQRCSTVL